MGRHEARLADVACESERLPWPVVVRGTGSYQGLGRHESGIVLCSPESSAAPRVPLRLVRTRSAALLLVLLTALPRLAALLHERGDILASFTDKGDDFARTFLANGTYGFIPGHPSAYTQPLYGWFLIPLYWIFGRSWPVVGLAQIAVAVATTLIVWQIGRRFIAPSAGLIAAVVVAVHPYLVWHDVHMNREVLDHLLAASIVYLTLHAAERLGWQRALPLGAVLGLGILGNVRLEGLPIVLGAYLLWRAGVSRRTAIATCALLAGAAVVVLPWVVRNEVSVGCLAVTTDARALWKANNVNTYETLKHGGWIDHVPQPKSFPPTPQDVFEHWQQDPCRAAIRRVRADDVLPTQGGLVLGASPGRQG